LLKENTEQIAALDFKNINLLIKRSVSKLLHLRINKKLMEY